MKKRKVSEDELQNLLRIFFPGGFSCSNVSDRYNAWYLGWLNVPGQDSISFPCEVNLDADGNAIVFHWYNESEEVTADQITGYIAGVMGLLAPDMERSNVRIGETTIDFEYKDKPDDED